MGFCFFSSFFLKYIFSCSAGRCHNCSEYKTWKKRISTFLVPRFNPHNLLLQTVSSATIFLWKWKLLLLNPTKTQIFSLHYIALCDFLIIITHHLPLYVSYMLFLRFFLFAYLPRYIIIIFLLYICVWKKNNIWPRKCIWGGGEDS